MSYFLFALLKNRSFQGPTGAGSEEWVFHGQGFGWVNEVDAMEGHAF